MVADDMGYGDFGLYSEGNVHTPALDELAGESVRLTQHYAGSAVCSPSRSALLTGRYPIRTGAVTPQEVLGNDRIALDEATIGDSFVAAGYATGMVGKWHNGALDPRFHPNARGFDEFVGFRGGWADYYKWTWYDFCSGFKGCCECRRTRNARSCSGEQGVYRIPHTYWICSWWEWL